MMKHLVTIAALGSAVLMLPPSDAHAACGNSQRIAQSGAECLEGHWWTEGSNWFTEEHHYKARNRCPDLGKVVAKVDRPNQTDVTWTFEYGDDGWKHGAHADSAGARNIYCCTDLSDLCDRSDLVNEQGCADRWDESSAASLCANERFIPHPEHSRCEISAKCLKDDGTLRPTSAHVHYHHVYRLTVCDGHLRQGC